MTSSTASGLCDSHARSQGQKVKQRSVLRHKYLMKRASGCLEGLHCPLPGLSFYCRSSFGNSYRGGQGKLADRVFLVWVEGAFALKLTLHLHHAPFWNATLTSDRDHKHIGAQSYRISDLRAYILASVRNQYKSKYARWSVHGLAVCCFWAKHGFALSNRS